MIVCAFLFLREMYAPILLKQLKEKSLQETGGKYTFDEDNQPVGAKLRQRKKRPTDISIQPIVLAMSFFLFSVRLVIPRVDTVYDTLMEKNDRKAMLEFRPPG